VVDKSKKKKMKMIQEVILLFISFSTKTSFVFLLAPYRKRLRQHWRRNSEKKDINGLELPSRQGRR
jgi:hypothetical protein